MPTHSLHLASGSSQYAGVADHADFDIGTFTIEAWIKLDSIPTEFHIAGKWRTTDSQRSYRFMIQGSGATFRLDTSSAGTAESQATASIGHTLEIGKWHHVAVTKTGTTAKFYLNGREYSATGTVESSVHSGSAPFRVGANGNASASGFIDGYIKDVRLFDDVRTASEIASDAYTESVSDANLVAEYNFNNAYTDSSGNSHTLTSSGSPVFSVDIPWTETAGIQSTDYVLQLKNASSQYAGITDASQTGLDNMTDMTWEAWIRLKELPSIASSARFILSKITGGTDSYYVQVTTADKIEFSVYGTGGNANFVTDAAMFTENDIGRWVHVAGTFAGSGNTGKIYKDGVEIASSNTGGSANNVQNSGADFQIGQANSGNYFDGDIKDVRIFDDVRTQTEILSDALASTVSNANLQGEWQLNNAYTDGSGNGNTLTASGSPVFKQWDTSLAGNISAYWELEEASGTRVDTHEGNDLTDNNTVTQGTGKQGNAADFERTNSEYLSITDASQTGLDITNNFSLSCWFNLESSTSGLAMVVMSKKGSGSNRSYVLKVSSAGTLAMQASSAGASFDRDTSVSWTETTSAWHHLVVTWHDGSVTYYLDGVQVGAVQSAGGTSIFDGNGDFNIGREATGSDHFDGLIDEAFVAKRVFSYGDVLDLYNDGNGRSYEGATNVTVNPSAQVATFSLPAETVNLGVTQSPAAQVATFSLPAETVNLGWVVSQGAPPVATFSIPAYSVDLGTTISPAAQVATFSIPLYTVDLPDATIFPNAQVATFSIPAYTVQYGWVITQGAPPVATFSIPAYSVGIGATISPNAQVATFSIPAYSVFYDHVVTVGVQTATFSIPAYTITAQTLVLANTQTATFSIPSYSIAFGIVLNPDTQVATFSLPTLAHFGAVWEKVARATNSTWSRTSRNST